MVNFELAMSYYLNWMESLELANLYERRNNEKCTKVNKHFKHQYYEQDDFF
jgi:hypothetical protein